MFLNTVGRVGRSVLKRAQQNFRSNVDFFKADSAAVPAAREEQLRANVRPYFGSSRRVVAVDVRGSLMPLRRFMRGGGCCNPLSRFNVRIPAFWLRGGAACVRVRQYYGTCKTCRKWRQVLL